jgi:protein-L-isoaspartate(D-aspartate) O-methyltransferase
MAPRPVDDSYGGYRARLVEALRARGISDLAVLRAFGEVPRHRFVPPVLERRAYEDTSLPVGNRQTISQPSTQARYLEALALTGRETVLEIGTGSGYQAALLSYLARRVITVERVGALATQARDTLKALHFDNVLVVTGDGSLGWREAAPYEAIVVAAVAPRIPPPLLEQLAEGGRLVAPVAGEDGQVLVRLTKQGGALTPERLGPAQFVPLIGRHGFPRDEEGSRDR